MYSINGAALCSETVQQRVTHVAIADNTLLLANAHGDLYFKDVLNLRMLTSLSLLVPVSGLAVTDRASHVLVALRDGKLIVIQKDGPPKAAR